MSGPELDAWLPDATVRTHRRRTVAAPPEDLWAAARAIRLSETRTLGRLVRWRIPGLPAEGRYDELFRGYPFTVLDEGERHLVSGLCGRIWTLARDYAQLSGPDDFMAWRRPHRADHRGPPTRLQHPVALGDASLRIGPVLDAARRDVAVERVVGEGEVLGVAEQLLAGRQRGLGARAGELVRALVDHRDVLGADPRDDALRREAGARAAVQRAQGGVVERGGVERRGAHPLRPEERVDPPVVDEREEPVEPVRLRLVLEQPQGRGH